MPGFDVSKMYQIQLLIDSLRAITDYRMNSLTCIYGFDIGPLLKIHPIATCKINGSRIRSVQEILKYSKVDWDLALK